MKKFGGVTLEEASKNWRNKMAAESYESVDTTDTTTRETSSGAPLRSNETLDHFPNDLVRSSSLKSISNPLPLPEGLPSPSDGATPQRFVSARELIDRRSIRSRAAKFPRDWPKSRLGQIRRRSCTSANLLHPCVKKAVSHLELLQMAIEDWFIDQQKDQEPKEPSVEPKIGGRSTWQSGLTFISRQETERDDASIHTNDSGETLDDEPSRTASVPQNQGSKTDKAFDPNAISKESPAICKESPANRGSKASHASLASKPSATSLASKSHATETQDADVNVKSRVDDDDDADDNEATTGAVSSTRATPGQRAARATHVSRVPPLSSIASSVYQREEEEEEEEETRFEENYVETEVEEEEEEEERFQLPEISAEEIVSEVMQLLQRLERDRIRLEDRVKQERNLIVRLQEEIDALMVQRMKDLPVAVQREHESCMLDVTELQWHVNYRGRVRTRTEKKVNKAREFNAKLKAELEHISKQGPLIQEKLGLLANATIKIGKGQDSLERSLLEQQANLARSEARAAETRNKAQMERGLMGKEQRGLGEEMARYTKDLLRANELHDQLKTEWSSFDAKMRRAEEAAEALELKSESVAATEEELENEIRELQIKIREQELEVGRVSEANAISTQEKEAEDELWAETLTSLATDLKGRTKSLQEVMSGIKENKGKIDETLERIRSCHGDKMERVKTQENHKREIGKNEEQMEFVKLELKKARKIHEGVGARLDEVNAKIVAAEDDLRAKAVDLKGRIKEERQTKTTIATKIQTEREDFDRLQAEAVFKMERVRKKAAEVESVVEGLQAKVEKLRNSHDEKNRVVEVLEEQMNHIAGKRREKEEELNEQIDKLEPVATSLNKKRKEFGRKQTFIAERTAEIKEETEKMEKEEVSLKEELDSVDAEVEELEDCLKEAETRLDSSEKIQSQLKKLKEENEKRKEEMKKIHESHMEERRAVKEGLIEKLTSERIRNAELASNYRRLRAATLQKKSEAMETFDLKNRSENGLKDMRTLRLLQERMSTALRVYFRLRGVFGADVVAEFTEESTISSERMEELKAEMGEALGKIDAFLEVYAKTV